jgi:hypothetical protein
MNGQLDMFSILAEDVKLSEVYEFLQNNRTPKYILGYEEQYEIYRKKGHCIQLNVYYDKKIDGCEKVIKKGVYLDCKGNNVYKIAHFSSEILPSMVNYDCGQAYNGGRCAQTDTTKFLKWFVNQVVIVDDMYEV